MSEILYNSWTGEVCDFSDYETGVHKAEKEDFKFGQILYLKIQIKNAQYLDLITGIIFLLLWKENQK